jgi:GntR family transcriptional regulator of vanillate catabolism
MSQTGAALVRLREMILNGELAPGERLTEIAVAARLGVSRTPLRTAFLQLAAEGLLDAVGSGGGFAVRAFSATDVNDAIELRGMLEGMAARLAAERGLEDSNMARLERPVLQIDALMKNREAEDAFERYVALNRMFHEEIADLSGSAVVKREVARVSAMPFASPSAFVMARSQWSNAWEMLVIAQEQHCAVIDAIRAREGMRAEALMREHATLAQRNLRRALVPNFFPDAPLRLVPGGKLKERGLENAL